MKTTITLDDIPRRTDYHRRLLFAVGALLSFGCGSGTVSDDDSMRLADAPVASQTDLNAGGTSANLMMNPTADGMSAQSSAGLAGASTLGAPSMEEMLSDSTASNAEGNDAGGNTTNEGQVEATIRILNPAAFGAGYSNVTVNSPFSSAITDNNGSATVAVAPGAYAITLAASNARTHTVFGVAGTEPFTQITYMSPEMITGFVFGQLGLMDQETKGILVVGLDTPTLAPAVGASAQIDVESDTPFVFAGSTPTGGQEIPSNGQGFVTFPNVTPGEVNIETSMANGRCRIFPAEDGAVTVTVKAGEVSVVAYTCRQEN